LIFRPFGRLRPDRSRNEGTPSPSERAVRRGKAFLVTFRRLEKVTRRKGGTLSSLHRSNGYAPNPKKQKKPRILECGALSKLKSKNQKSAFTDITKFRGSP
jgi:hypothetical protein